MYVLESGASIHWRKLGIEGFFYILKRDSLPRYRILLRNQTDSGEGDFIQSIDDNIRFEVKEGTFFYQIGDHGNVRGLWFHDRDFMPKFVRIIEYICSELGLLCDGTFDGINSVKQSPAPNTTSGKAILQMLKKADVTPAKETRNHADPQSAKATPAGSIVDLLRQEFATPRMPPPPPPVLREPMSDNRSQLPYPPPPPAIHPYTASPQPEFMGPLGIPPPHPDPFARPGPPVDPYARPGMPVLSDMFSVCKSDLRIVLGDMIGSDQFINELFHRLAHRSRQ